VNQGVSVVGSDWHLQDDHREVALSDNDPIAFRPRVVPPSLPAPLPPSPPTISTTTPVARFSRQELHTILNLYGRKVACGEWRDYAIDFGREKAVFSVFRRSSECPLYTIEKSPKLTRKQGAYSVVAASGLILKRGHDLLRVLEVLDKQVRLLRY
jgi:Protein of unknown function (DUF2794)